MPARPAAVPAPGSGDDELTTERRILMAAAELFPARGFAGTSMESVAERAGTSRRTVFNLFATKEQVFRAAVQQSWEDMPIARIAGEATLGDDPRAGLSQLGRAIADFWATPAAVALLQLTIAERARFPHLAEDYLTYGKRPALRGLVDYITGLAARRLLVVEDAELAARQYVGMINEPLLWWRVLGEERTPSARERARVVDEAVATFLSRYGR